MAIKAVIFDCDGTLVDSEDLANEVLVEYLSELGHVMAVHEAIEAYTGMKMADCLLDIEARFKRPLPKDFASVLRQRMSTAFSGRLVPIEGARELVASIEVPIHIASSGPREKIVGSLLATDLHAFFSNQSSIFSAYEIGHWKPDPAFYSAVIGKLGIEAHEAVVIEDSVPGIRASLGAGIKTIALGRDERLIGDLSAALPASNLAEVGLLLEALIGHEGRVDV